jgi:hypothetical protein
MLGINNFIKKKYGYQVKIDADIIDNSVFSGIERDSLTFDELLQIRDGAKLKRGVPTRFKKSIVDMNIVNQNLELTLSKTHHKTLVDNDFIPITIANNVNTNSIINNIVKRFKRLLSKWLHIKIYN